MAFLGEGIPQFTVHSWVDDRLIKSQPIHDPFIHSRTVIVLGRWTALKHFFRPTPIQVVVSVSGTHAAQSRIMTMDPEAMERENQDWERDRYLSFCNTAERAIA